jgi:hypothetical protein
LAAAAAAVSAAAVAAAAAVVAADDRRPIMTNLIPSFRRFTVFSRLVLGVICGAALACAPKAERPPAPPGQQLFSSPEAAVASLVTALKAPDSAALLGILGPGAADLVDSGDAVVDAATRQRFVAAYEEAHSFDKSEDGFAILQTGRNEWPFPIPLVESEKGWFFDTAEGKQEIIDRRVGRNELAAIQVCQAYGDAQREYYEMNPEGDALHHYAQSIASTPGKRDGLYWEAAEGEPESPLGPGLARARAEGYTGELKGRPYHGYRYKVLTAQGPDAPGGAYDYVVPGKKMIGGFALVAYPAEYGNSGVMTFLINHDGVVYEKDLGPQTEEVAAGMTIFNPDKTWKRATTDEDA